MTATGAPHTRSGDGRDRLERRLARADLHLPAFTAEELAAIDPRPPDQRLVALPDVDRLGGAGRHGALQAARRALGAQQLVDDEGRPVGPLRLVHELRTAPNLVGVVTRFHGAERHDTYLYGLGTVAVLEERPGTDGVHRFVLRSPARTGSVLARWSDPDGHAGDTDQELEEHAEPAAVDDLLASASTVTTVAVVGGDATSPARRAAVHVLVGEGCRTWVLAATAPPARWVAREVSGPTLAVTLEALLCLPGLP